MVHLWPVRGFCAPAIPPINSPQRVCIFTSQVCISLHQIFDPPQSALVRFRHRIFWQRLVILVRFPRRTPKLMWYWSKQLQNCTVIKSLSVRSRQQYNEGQKPSSVEHKQAVTSRTKRQTNWALPKMWRREAEWRTEHVSGPCQSLNFSIQYFGDEGVSKMVFYKADQSHSNFICRNTVNVWWFWCLFGHPPTVNVPTHLP